jgi:hypothetical protein
MREVPTPHMGSQTSWPGSEDSATTAHIENEAVSKHVGGALNLRRATTDRPTTSRNEGIHRMTDTEQTSATPAEASADYQKTIRVKANPGALFDALTSVSDLAALVDPGHGIRRRRRRTQGSSLTP